LAAKTLIAQRHQVVLHARNKKSGQEALDKVPGAETAVTADLGTSDHTKPLASTRRDFTVNTLAESAILLIIK
jgi:hypothetical protein